MGLTWEQVREWVVASTRAQGVPLLVTDPVTLVNVGSLLKPRAGLGGRDAGGAPSRVALSDDPQGLDSVGVESSPATTGVDDCVVKDGANDRHLPVQVQLRPRLV